MAKNIVLCSDGTGNRWGAGNQTNVSKLYEAVETDGLHDGKRQIRFYDNGVGTSSNKYLRAVTGAFGFGLRRNVLDLYEFLARHWQPGDRIYLFGFSRGAATVRAFAGMLQECGLVWTEGDYPDCKAYDEERLDELMDLAMDAYRKRDPDPDRKDANREALESFWRSVEASGGGFKLQRKVPIRMIGVWDTVSALGFPKGPRGPLRVIFAAAEALADKLFPHSFYNYRLDDRVELACHALAIDDERRTFRPMVWNELEEPRPRRLEQVWFAGMHSDVGGGYPRTGLATTALRWMTAHATRQGLGLRHAARDEARDKSNPHGKMHDSRDGGGIYYRYLPRDLVVLCEEGIAWKGPERTAEGDEPKVARGEVKIHRSVLQRLHEGTARYAPGLLPRSFVVVDDPSPGAAAPAPAPVTVRSGDGWQDQRNETRKWTLRRSILYHVFLYASLAVVIWMLALWVAAPDGEAEVEAAAAPTALAPVDWASRATRVVFGRFEEILHWALPAAAEPFVSFVLVEQPLWLIGLVGLALGLFRIRTWCFTSRDLATQEARKQTLVGWVRATGGQLCEKRLAGQADARRLRLGGVLLQLLLIALAALFTMGAFRITLAGSPVYELAKAVAWTLGLPALAFLLFAALFRLTGRRPGRKPLNERFGGYDPAAVAADWSRRDLAAERRFLRLDLVFPLAYGAAFAASFRAGCEALGGPPWIWQGLALLVLVPVVADWVENWIHLRQIRRFEKDPESLQEGSLRVASRATVIKLWGVVAAWVLVGLFALGALALAIRTSYF